MKNSLANLGAMVFFACVITLFIGLIIFIVAMFIRDNNRQKKLFKFALKTIVFSLIGGVVGFGVCADNLTLGVH